MNIAFPWMECNMLTKIRHAITNMAKDSFQDGIGIFRLDMSEKPLKKSIVNRILSKMPIFYGKQMCFPFEF